MEAAHARLRRTRTSLSTAIGTRREVIRRDYESKYLLTGFVRCATCGGSITVVSRLHERLRAYFYGCLTNWKRGATVCPNDLVLPIDRLNDAVLKAITSDVLRPAVVSAIIDGFLEQLLPPNVETRVEELRRALGVLDTKIQNLTTPIEQGGVHLPSIIASGRAAAGTGCARRGDRRGRNPASDPHGPGGDRVGGTAGGRQLARPAGRVRGRWPAAPAGSTGGAVAVRA